MRAVALSNEISKREVFVHFDATGPALATKLTILPMVSLTGKPLTFSGSSTEDAERKALALLSSFAEGPSANMCEEVKHVDVAKVAVVGRRKVDNRQYYPPTILKELLGRKLRCDEYVLTKTSEPQNSHRAVVTLAYTSNEDLANIYGCPSLPLRFVAESRDSRNQAVNSVFRKMHDAMRSVNLSHHGLGV